MEIFSTSIFRRDLKKPGKKNGYKNVQKDVWDELGFKTSGDVIDFSDVIVDGDAENKVVFVKTRYKNSTSKTGKSGGFRTYGFVYLDQNIIVLICIYPKSGPQKRTPKADPKERMIWLHLSWKALSLHT